MKGTREETPPPEELGSEDESTFREEELAELRRADMEDEDLRE